MSSKENFKIEFNKDKEKVDIEQIENLDFLGTQDRMILILTYLGEKPVTKIELSYIEQYPYTDLNEIILKREKLERLLKKLGLKFKIIKRIIVNENGFEEITFEFLISRDKKKIEELEKAINENDSRKMGELYGYPKTAVDAYVKSMRILKEKRKNKRDILLESIFDRKKWFDSLSEEERSKLIEEGVLNFLTFTFSKKHWREELDVVRKWQSIIKEKSPRLYQEIIESKIWYLMTEEEKIKWSKEVAEKELNLIREKILKKAQEMRIEIDKEINEIVIMLNAFDFRIVNFYKGSVDKEPICGPWILIGSKKLTPKETNEELRNRLQKQQDWLKKRMINILNKFYEKRSVYEDVKIVLVDTDIGFKIQNKGSDSLKFLGSEERLKKLKDYQQEFVDFANFLKEKYSDYLLYHTDP
jgi:hypothetical protein